MFNNFFTKTVLLFLMFSLVSIQLLTNTLLHARLIPPNISIMWTLGFAWPCMILFTCRKCYKCHVALPCLHQHELLITVAPSRVWSIWPSLLHVLTQFWHEHNIVFCATNSCIIVYLIIALKALNQRSLYTMVENGSWRGVEIIYCCFPVVLIDFLILNTGSVFHVELKKQK